MTEPQAAAMFCILVVVSLTLAWVSFSRPSREDDWTDD